MTEIREKMSNKLVLGVFLIPHIFIWFVWFSKKKYTKKALIISTIWAVLHITRTSLYLLDAFFKSAAT